MAEPIEPSNPPIGPQARFVALEALRVTLGRPPVWLLILAVECLLALPATLAFHGFMSDAVHHHHAPGSLLANLPENFLFDHRDELKVLNDAGARMGAALALFAMLFGCFCAGGWLQVFLERTRGESLRRFFFGGARYFWRYFRLLILSLVTLACLAWVVYGTPWNRVVLHWMFGVPPGDFTTLETLASEATAFKLRFAQNALHAVLFGLVLTWGDYTRTRMALHDTNSAVWAGLCTWWAIMRHPVKTLRPMIGLFAIEVSIVLVLGWLARSLEGDVVRSSQMITVALMFAAAQFALLWRIILRGSRYHAAVQVSREIVRPIARPDPWKASVGGPGGPRYPIGDDEYTVSI
ncbi:MAG: hypothetical protein JNL28_09095 [Planctomycetes bacterium]|nr:hypothetical protein [Planctomycetota bacterium]